MALDRRVAEPEVINRGPLIRLYESKASDGHSFLNFAFQGEAEPRKVPFLEIRNPDDHKAIAKAVTSRRPVLFMAGGVIGSGLMCTPDGGEGRMFWDVLKPGREATSMVPIFAENEMQYELVDWEKLHPEFRFLENGRRRRDFFGQLPIHAVFPFNHNDKVTDVDTFVTRPEYMAQEHPMLQTRFDSVCLYFQRDDDWVRIAQFAADYFPMGRFGITSNNEHRQPGIFTWDEFKELVFRKSEAGKRIWEADVAAILRDRAAERVNVGSSQTQVRFSQIGEAEPMLWLVRHGPVGPRLIEKQTGVKVGVPTDENGTWVVRYAERSRPNAVDLEHLVEMQTREINADIAARRHRRHIAA